MEIQTKTYSNNEIKEIISECFNNASDDFDKHNTRLRIFRELLIL
jgi:hypothetical protein